MKFKIGDKVKTTGRFSSEGTVIGYNGDHSYKIVYKNSNIFGWYTSESIILIILIIEPNNLLKNLL